MSWVSTLGSAGSGALAGGASGGPLGAVIGGLGGLLGGIGAKRQSGAVKKAGTTLADQYNRNANDLLLAGDRAANGVLESTVAGQSRVDDATLSGQGKLSDAVNFGVGRIDESLKGLNPYIELGTKGTNAINEGFDTNDAGLKFLVDQGVGAIKNDTALKGIFGGNTGRAVADYTTGTAQKYRTNWLDDQLKLVDRGRSAVDERTAGQFKNADLMYQGGRDIADLGFRGAGKSADLGVEGATYAGDKRYAAMGDATGQRTGAAQATAASQIGSTSILSQLLNSAGGTLNSVTGDISGILSKILGKKAKTGVVDLGSIGGDAAFG